MKNRTKRMISLILTGSLSLTLLAACSSSQDGNSGGKGTGSGGDAASLELSLTTHDPATGPMTLFLEQWGDQVAEATSGQIGITVYPGATLSAGTDVAEAVLTGTVDIGWCFTTFFPNQFPLTEVTTLPMLGLSHPSEAAEVLWDLYDYSEDLRTELADYKVLMMLGNPPNMLFTAKKPVHTLEDLAGLQIRAVAGVPTALVTAWGGVPVLMTPSDTYEALSKGIVDGCIFEYSGTTTVNMQEHLNYYTELNIYMGVFLLLMNKDRWDSLPTEVQQAMDSVSLRTASVEGGKVFYEDNANSRAIIEQTGATFITPTDEAIQEFEVAALEYAQNWVSEKSTDTFDAQDYYNKTIELVEKYAATYQ